MKDFLEYIWHHKKWWLAPLVIMVVLISFIVITTEILPVSPFIYVLF